MVILVLIANTAFLLRYLINSRLDDNGLLIPPFFDDINDDDNGILADKTNFKYLISKTGCKLKNSNDPQLHPNFLIAVNSNPLSKKMRQTIRDSWGNYGKNAQTIFFLGAVESDQVQKEIEAEDLEFGDIIQGNFIDNEYNLAYKHLMILKWSVEKCYGAKYLIKIDDHVFANVPAISDFLTDNLISTNFLMGAYRKPEQCPRDGNTKISYEEYASDYYPAYAERHSVIYSIDVAAKLFYKSHLVNFFWVEDVFVTGILRSQINVDIEPIDKYILTLDSLTDMRIRTLNLPSPTNFMFSLPNLTVQDQVVHWERTEWYRLGENSMN